MPGLRLGPWSYQIVRGEPIEVRNYRLVPLARLFRIGRSKAKLSSELAECYGTQMVSIAPAGMVVQRQGERRLLPIIDCTKALLLSFAGVCCAAYVGYRALSQLLEEPTGGDRASQSGR